MSSYLRSQGHYRGHGGPLTWHAAHLELSTQLLHPLTHAPQPDMPARTGELGVKALPVIGDGQFDVARIACQSHAHMLGLRVSEHVVHGFLDGAKPLSTR